VPLYPYQGKSPRVAPDAFIAPTACVIGDVEIGAGASVWFNATVRADTSYIRVGPGTSVQDNAVIHTDPGVPTIIGANCTLGHNAIVHSSVVGDNVLVGTAAVLTGHNSVGSESVIGAGAVLPAGMTVPGRKVALGVPAKIVRDVGPGDARWTHLASEHYQELSSQYRETLGSGQDTGVARRDGRG
jgi:carbonic anhydrase/acetyltransferase-like protein (isoleucine patch superfamily)